MIEIRPANEGDMPFVFTTWLKCFKRESQFANRIRHNLFFPYHHKIIEGIARRPGAILLVATPTGDPNIIVGYLCAERATEGNVFHFAFTKPAFRRMGVAKKLLEASEMSPERCYFTHWTDSVDKIGLSRRFPGADYAPYLW